jgi:uncharacterized membrane-anchored protein YjiN (DUF445 family)
MSGADRFLPGAIAIVQQAIQLDKEEKYQEAMEKYLESLERFMVALKYEKNPTRKEIIQQRVAGYMKRAEALKVAMKEQKASDKKAAAVLEMNCETDFVARNENFQEFVQKISETAAAGAGTNDALLGSSYSSESATVADEVTRLIATIGENMQFRRVERLSVNNGMVATYTHMPTPGQKNMGKIAYFHQ